MPKDQFLLITQSESNIKKIRSIKADPKKVNSKHKLTDRDSLIQYSLLILNFIKYSNIHIMNRSSDSKPCKDMLT